MDAESQTTQALDRPSSDMSLQEAKLLLDSLANAEELSLHEAVAAFEVSALTLRRLLNAGLIGARRVRGVSGQEWRLTASAIEQAGYRRRPAGQVLQDPQSSEIRRLTRALVAERARSSDLDGRLGHALLTIGCLRQRLREAGVDADDLFGADLKAQHDNPGRGAG